MILDIMSLQIRWTWKCNLILMGKIKFYFLVFDKVSTS